MVYLRSIMSLISVSNLGKSFGPDDIFANISVSIPQRARIGLVGPNGVGKTTFMRILVDEEEASSGNVIRSRDVQVGYLPQVPVFESTKTLWEECLDAFRELIALEEKLNRMEADMSNPEKADEIMENYGRLQDEFERAGGYTYEAQIKYALGGLGFDEEEYQKPLMQLSGGQRTRALLARLLLSNPDLLLLDEPTNHLDIDAIEWLEGFLRDWEGAVLVVSHDRYFLDQVVNTIWEMTPQLEVYRGNYSSYQQQRGERYQRRIDEYNAQKAFIEKEEEYIRRNIAGQNTRQAQGRRKRLERLLEETQLLPPRDSRRLGLRLSPVNRSGDLVIRTYDLNIGYEDDGEVLFKVPELVLQRGECAAILGPNGAGKTTFLKTILGKLAPLMGRVELGASLKIGYFAQAHAGLHDDWTLMQEIEQAAANMLPGEIRNYLAKFLFTGDDVFKQVGLLSGGERGRLALACLALSDANLLLLDEPTSHLDLASQEVLQNVLADYAGTILLVSHDRYLVDALATQIWEIKPDMQELNPYSGSYSEYRRSMRVDEQGVEDGEQGQEKSQKQGWRNEDQRAAEREDRRRRRRLEELEGEIARLEAQLNNISQQLENPPDDIGQVEQLGQEYNTVQETLNRHLDEWAELL